MTTHKEALTLALDYVEGVALSEVFRIEVRDAIKEALAQPEQEPVAYVIEAKSLGAVALKLTKELPVGTQLYTTPPQRTWVGLTPQERDEINEQVYGAVPHHVAFHAAIEAKLKEKNA